MLPAAERKRRGAWYTPPALVRHVVEHTITPQLVESCRAGIVRVLDPACGDARFLVAAAEHVRRLGGTPVLTGVDIDLNGLRAASVNERIEAIEADAFTAGWAGRRFDAVVGNPPFLNQLSSATARPEGSRFGGGPYADIAADFLALSVDLLRDGGRAGLVLPLSLLAARDAGPIRCRVDAVAAVGWFWWSDAPVFDAGVRTCAMGFERQPRSPATIVTRATGARFASVVAAPRPAAGEWAALVSDTLGVPPVPPLRTRGSLGDIALVTANFRDQYYALIGAVSDHNDGPPLVTTGLIDPGVCHWGERPTRFAKVTYQAPRVDRLGLPPFMQRWIDRCLVPKVLIATQTRVLEAVVDAYGSWLPAVPVIRAVPSSPDDLWRVAAILTSPVTAALIARQSAGSGLSAATIRVSQRTVGMLPLPSGDLTEAARALRHDDIDTCAALVDRAYGVDDDTLLAWWQSARPASAAVTGR